MIYFRIRQTIMMTIDYLFFASFPFADFAHKHNHQIVKKNAIHTAFGRWNRSNYLRFLQMGDPEQ